MWRSVGPGLASAARHRQRCRVRKEACSVHQVVRDQRALTASGSWVGVCGGHPRVGSESVGDQACVGRPRAHPNHSIGCFSTPGRDCRSARGRRRSFGLPAGAVEAAPGVIAATDAVGSCPQVQCANDAAELVTPPRAVLRTREQHGSTMILRYSTCRMPLVAQAPAYQRLRMNVMQGSRPRVRQQAAQTNRDRARRAAPCDDLVGRIEQSRRSARCFVARHCGFTRQPRRVPRRRAGGGAP